MADILIVDDDMVLLKLYSTRLLADGHNVKTASNGQDALDQLEDFSPNVIILDLLMPKMNGFTFLEKIKSMPNTSHVPVIVFSSVANKEQIKRLEDLGVTHHLNKIETSPTQLVNIVNQTINNHT